MHVFGLGGVRQFYEVAWAPVQKRSYLALNARRMEQLLDTHLCRASPLPPIQITAWATLSAGEWVSTDFQALLGYVC
jgi:hypothetical protein